MKFIRIILFPLVPIYFLVTWFRNWLYDVGLKPSKSYDIPIICVGNLSTGGTGKTPMIEYLIRLLIDHKSLATLSRGYKRKTDGFVLADETSDSNSIGDEPYQFYRKFDGLMVAVDANRQKGIAQLMALSNTPQVILLDDAYQHRKVKAGFNILLSSYDNLYYKDIVLPSGNLREPRSGARRANVVVITKCPKTLSEEAKTKIKRKLHLDAHQQVFFSHLDYSKTIISADSQLELETLPRFTLVTGIANATPLVDYLRGKGLKFDHLEYPDHYYFRPSDLDSFNSKDLILTTEKDFVRLSGHADLERKLYYLPIKIGLDNESLFNETILSFVN